MPAAAVFPASRTTPPHAASSAGPHRSKHMLTASSGTAAASVAAISAAAPANRRSPGPRWRRSTAHGEPVPSVRGLVGGRLA